MALLLSFGLCSTLLAETAKGIPNLSTRLNGENTTIDCFATLLVWNAREIGADCWAEVITPVAAPTSNSLAQLNFDWNPGFRVGLGYGMEYDQWDTQLFFTWFHTKGVDHISSVPGAIHSTFIGNFYIDNATGAGISGPTYREASIDWTIRFNMFDGELGRNYWVSHALSLRPFVGIKGGWIHQKIDTKWEFATTPIGFSAYNLGKENLKNNFWGIGPSAGVNMRWDLLQRPSDTLHLFGDFSGALMWGHWTFGDLFQNDLGQTVTVNVPNVNSGATMMRTFMGFGWNTNIGQTVLTTRLGYESQFWLDQLQFYSFVGGTLNTALTLQGGSLELSYDF